MVVLHGSFASILPASIHFIEYGKMKQTDANFRQKEKVMATILFIAVVLLVVIRVPTRSLSRHWGKRLVRRAGSPVKGPFLIGFRPSQSEVQDSSAIVRASLLPDAASWEWQECGREPPPMDLNR